MKTILVTDQVKFWQFAREFTDVVDAKEYLSNKEFLKQRSLRIINICHSYRYQSMGYYVSLLAQARGHKMLPSALSIQDLANNTLASVLYEPIETEVQNLLRNIKSDKFDLSIYFGKNLAKRYNKICSEIYNLFPAPLLRVEFVNKKSWKINKIKLITIKDIPPSHHDFLKKVVEEFFNKKRVYIRTKKSAIFDLAVLVNPHEKTPPSNQLALDKFVTAGKKLDINVEMIEKADFVHLSEFNALFIRETTAVGHYTYRFSRSAAANGLVVIDDPESILKCANKVYLHELMERHKVPSAETVIIHKKNWEVALKKIGLPCVLKLPDSAFSKGVAKAEDYDSYREKAKEFLSISDLIIGQAFIPTEFDWRIGVFNNEVLYACRYYMAKDHWQIYNWQCSDEFEGNFETVALEDVPKTLITTALKVCQIIGNGLYGVDLKEINKKVYVVEVNDNPNIDAGVEDAILKDNLYDIIMNGFLQRIRQSLRLTEK